MAHIVLLGDSIFDNAAYVGGGPDVTAQVNALLPAGSSATLRAIDGAVVSGVAHQARDLPAGSTHLVVSAGGNDALGQAPLLRDRVGTVAEVVERLAWIRDGFARDYRAMLDAVLAHGIPTAVCTVYDARFPDPAYQRLVVTALAIFNDVILREAFARALTVIDLRLICDEDADYANPIEPSSHGGAKIAAAIAALAAEPPIARRRPVVFTR